MKINIINKTHNKINKYIFNKINFILKKHKTIDIKITNEKEIKILNKKYRKKHTSTDVLTFKNENIKTINNIGCITLCPKIMFKKHKKNCWEKIIIHSILHILNYDHLEKKDFTIMSKIEKKIGMSGIEPPTITTSK